MVTSESVLAVDAVYVLSVKTFTQRIAHIEREMVRHGIKFEFVFEFDVPELDGQLIANTFGPSDLKNCHQSLVLKHIYTWRMAEAAGLRRILVFEDDVVLAPDFTTRFASAMQAADALPAGYLVYLGGADAKVPDYYFLSPGLLVELPIATTEGYVTDLEAIRRRLTWLETNKVSLPADHLIKHIDASLGVTQYWLSRPIVEQGSVLGIFPSVLDGSRQKHSALFNRLRNGWNKFQRHSLRRWLAHIKSHASR
jgi:glycosyl transferase family 25